MAKKPEPPKPIVWGIYKIAPKAVWLGNVEAPDEATAMEKGAVRIHAGQADGATPMTRRKGEITRGDLKEQMAALRGAPGRKCRRLPKEEAVQQEGRW